MTKSIDALKTYFQRQKQQAFQDYFTFLKFPSISSEPTYTSHVLACADWLAEYLRRLGFEVDLWRTSGHPTIFASHTKAGPNKPTLLIYNHYDVQPVDPIEEWHSPPFDPAVRDGEVYARGAQDNKGQCFYTIQALKALLELNKTLPLNIKLCIEGEEECGSMGLSTLLQTKKEQLKADYLAIVDVGIRQPNTPAVTLGTRGIVTFDVTAEGTQTDLHSGSHGGLAYNPIHALVELFGSMRAPNGKITIPGFYDDIAPLNDKEKKLLTLYFDEKQYQQTFGTNPTGGEQELLPSERVWLRPTLEINGIAGGYYGPGFKTVIPAKASAKISCRLVPNQDPKKIGSLIKTYLEQHAPKGIKVTATIHSGGGKAVCANPASRAVEAFSQAFSEVFNKPCEKIFEGGSIPISAELAAASGTEIVFVGVGLPDDHIHAPNEHFGLDRFEQGFLMMARAIELLGYSDLK